MAALTYFFLLFQSHPLIILPKNKNKNKKKKNLLNFSYGPDPMPVAGDTEINKTRVLPSWDLHLAGEGNKNKHIYLVSSYSAADIMLSSTPILLVTVHRDTGLKPRSRTQPQKPWSQLVLGLTPMAVVWRRKEGPMCPSPGTRAEAKESRQDPLGRKGVMGGPPGSLS